MSAVAKDLLRQFEQAGIHLEPRGDKLHAEAKPGVLTPEMRAQLTANKPVLMHLLQTTIPASDSIRTRLLSIADAECIDPSLIRRLPDADLDACERLPVETLRAYIRALRASDLRERGKVPGDETAAALCRHCGPIWLHPAVVSVAPIVDGWARVLGCPWCHVRNRRAIPRPLVTCGDCRHFASDAINPEGGMGRCMAGREPLPRALPFPHAARQCAQFNKSEKITWATAENLTKLNIAARSAAIATKMALGVLRNAQRPYSTFSVTPASERLKVQGKGIKRPGLTGSLLQNS